MQILKTQLMADNDKSLSRCSYVDHSRSNVMLYFANVWRPHLRKFYENNLELF